MAQTQGRKWQITLNNPLDKDYSHDNIKLKLSSLKALIYYCMADEIGLETQTPHTHIYIAAQSAIRFSTIKKRFPESHVEQAFGSSQENRDYILKSGKWAEDSKSETSIEGSFEEWGEMPLERPGTRSDLDFLYQLVKDGKSNFEILEENSDYLLRLTDIERVRQTVRAEEFRTKFREMQVTYLWGKTGTGKTRFVMEREGYAAVYRVTEYEHPFDGYAGQETLVLDEYRSQLKISELLNLLDGYPLELRCRYSNKVACFDTVYIISNIDLSKQYLSIQVDQPATWAALLRRIHKVIKFFSDGHKTEYAMPDYLHTFVELDQNELPQSLPFG